MRFYESVLAVEISDKTLRAAVAQKTFGGVRLLEHIELQRQSPFSLLTDEELSAVLAGIPNTPREVVAVCNCTVLEIFMERAKLKKLGRAGQLKDALRWELEEYMPDGSGLSMLGYEVSKQKSTRGFLRKRERPSTAEEQIWVSVLAADQFSELAAVFQRQGKKLARVYPPEACSPQAALYGSRKKEMLILDLGDTATKFHVLKGRAVRSLRDLPFGFEELSDEIEATQGKSLVEEYKNFRFSLAGKDYTVFVCGPGAAQKNLTDWLAAKFNEDLEVLAPAGCGPDCAALCNLFGAAVREFSVLGIKRSFGIDDSVPLKLRVKEKIHVFPIAVMGGIALLFVLHYGIMQWQLHTLTKNIGKLEASKATFKEQSETYASYQQQRSDLEKSILDHKSKIDFLNYKVEERITIISDLMRGVSENSRSGLLTLHIQPEDMDGLFTLQGQAVTLESINQLVLGVQESQWCKDVRVETIRRNEGKDDSELLTFVIRITTAEPVAGKEG